MPWFAIFHAYLAGPGETQQFPETAKDVTDAIESQNAQIAVGHLVVHLPSISRRSTPPLTPSTAANTRTVPRYHLEGESRRLEVRLGDVATVEMGAEKYDYLAASMVSQPPGWG